MSLEGLLQLEPGKGKDKRSRPSSLRPDRDERRARPARPAQPPSPGRPAPPRAPRADVPRRSTATITRSHHDPPPPGRGDAVVPGGPRDYRRRLRRRGPLAALAGPVALLIVAAVIRTWLTGDGVDGLQAASAVYVLVLLALPTAAAAGLPWTAGTGLVVAAATSGLAWAAIGAYAARRATRTSPVAGWREWCRVYALVAAAVWAGALAGLGAFAWALTHGG